MVKGLRFGSKVVVKSGAFAKRTGIVTGIEGKSRTRKFIVRFDDNSCEKIHARSLDLIGATVAQSGAGPQVDSAEAVTGAAQATSSADADDSPSPSTGSSSSSSGSEDDDSEPRSLESDAGER